MLSFRNVTAEGHAILTAFKLDQGRGHCNWKDGAGIQDLHEPKRSVTGLSSFSLHPERIDMIDAVNSGNRITDEFRHRFS